MKKLFIIPLLFLTLTGCVGSDSSRVTNLLAAVTTTVANPVDAVDLNRISRVYAATLELANSYRDYCYSRSYKSLMADPIAKPVCQNRRANIRAIQIADTKAFAALQSAKNFVRNNPTLNATSAILAAWRAVTDYQSLMASAAALAAK